MNKTWLNISFVYLFLVVFLGTILRLLNFVPVGINYGNLLHAHSHLAFLGWIYNVLFVILTGTFISPEKRNGRVYKEMFWFTQIANVGILISFPIQGYGLYSIFFSTLHILTTYWFAYHFLRDANRNPFNIGKHYLSFGFIKAAVLFMLLSSVGPLCMGPIIAIWGAGTDLYYNAIYFYLHFQYNGWFFFAIMGLFFWLLENNNIAFSFRKGNTFYHYMSIACVPAYFLSVLWTKPDAAVYIIGGISAFLQIIGLIIFLSLINEIKNALKKLFNCWLYFLTTFSLVSFCLKILLQQAGAFPFVANLAYQVRNFIIGYLHLIFIGVVTIFIFAFLIKQNKLIFNLKSRLALVLFIAGYVLSEIIIFVQALLSWWQIGIIPYYAAMLFYVSVIMTIGAAMLAINQVVKRGVSLA